MSAIQKIKVECSECLRSDSLRGEFTEVDADSRAGVMCEGLADNCETPDACTFEGYS